MQNSQNIGRSEPCPVCGRYANRTVAIDALIIRGKSVLLIKRGVEPEKGKWALPGGHIDWDETIENAVVREIKEETNLQVVNSRFLAIYSAPNRHPKQMLAAVYLVEVTGTPSAGSDAEVLDYFPMNSIPDNLAFDHKEIIGNYYAKNR